MTSTTNYGEVTMNDRGSLLDLQGKRIRMSKGATPVFRSPHYTEHFVDKGITAMASWLPKTWTATETGTGTSHAVFVNTVVSTGGVYAVGVAGATSANAQELALTNVGWAPATQAVAATSGTQVLAQSRMFMEARVKWVGATTAADGDCFIGFADVVTATSGLSYDISLTSTVTATGLTEGAMIGYSSIPTSLALHPAAGNNLYGVFTTKATTAAAPKAATLEDGTFIAKDSLFHIFRVEIDGAGNCAFYIDDRFVGSSAAAVTAATALTPYVGVIGRNSHACTATIDYISVGGSEI